MSTNRPIKVGLLKQSELDEAGRIVRLAFGTFLGLPNPLDFMGDRNLMAPRWRSTHVKVIAAREGGRLIGSNVATRWGSFGFFRPLTVLPEYWDRGVAQRLLEATMTIFDRWGVRHTGLFTFPQSAKHVGLYQKFGYWPRYLTAIMTRTPEANPASQAKPAHAPALLSAFTKSQREQAIQACGKLTHKIDKGLDLAGEIRAVLAQRTGDVVLTYTRGVLDAFAVCLNGPGSEGGETTCYVKFGAARGGAGAGERFDKLLDACEVFASSRGATVEAGVNLAREDAYRRLRSHGYRVTIRRQYAQKGGRLPVIEKAFQGHFHASHGAVLAQILRPEQITGDPTKSVGVSNWNKTALDDGPDNCGKPRIAAEVILHGMAQCYELARLRVDQLLDDWIAGGKSEVMESLIHPFPALVIADWMGLPRTEWARFMKWCLRARRRATAGSRGYRIRRGSALRCR